MQVPSFAEEPSGQLNDRNEHHNQPAGLNSRTHQTQTVASAQRRPYRLWESPRRVRRLHQLRKRWGLGHGKIEISAGAAGACGPDGRRGMSEL
jgi:hypothetical protein